MREGSVDSPTRNVIDWDSPDFIDKKKLDAEMRRQFDICHGCRRCFNLCESFPRLFDLIDDAGDDELDGVDSKNFKGVVDACTLCDMCFLTKCPYVPPHEFNIDFPHMMLRYRAAETAKKKVGFIEKQLTETDRNGKIAGIAPRLANWGTRRSNILTRPTLELVAGIHRNAELPRFVTRVFLEQSKLNPPKTNTDAPAFGRKAVIFATCFTNYNDHAVGSAALNVLAKNGVETEVVYPQCCGMPQLEQGDIGRVARNAIATASTLRPYIEQGKDVIALMPSCALMMKSEWPLIAADDENVKKLSTAAYDITEYIVDIAENEGLAEGLGSIEGGIALHFACHARAQNMGPKAAEMLRAIPDTDVEVVARCSGHGGSWGIKKENFDLATKYARVTSRRTIETNKKLFASECPLAAKHLAQTMEEYANNTNGNHAVHHPVQILAQAYGLDPSKEGSKQK